jgi:chemotaxis protein methyltransferase CheR
MQVTAEDVRVMSRLVNDLCGIVLDETKGYLIQTRLSSVAEAAGCQSFSELYYKVRYANDSALQTKIIDAITTNETLFFRDTSPFEAMQHKVIPNIIDARAKTAYPRRLRIWSAASSTGQEAYSIAIILRELLGDVSKWDISILATDISDAVIRQASLGRYADHEIQRGMKPDLLNKYFVREANCSRVKDEIRAMVAFRKINLLQPFLGIGTFDVIFCRNVAIYFSPDARRDLFRRLTQQLTEDGYLFVGAAESLTDLGKEFMPQHHCRAIFYQPNRKPAMAMA